MRADTHDGPEQMLHVRGLIHCCSSHVRRSWNSVLQRTAGPYILALLPQRTVPLGIPLSVSKRTRSGNTRKTALDPTAGISLLSATSSMIPLTGQPCAAEPLIPWLKSAAIQRYCGDKLSSRN